MSKEEMIKKCADMLNNLCGKVELYNSLNFYDINISSEYFFAEMLNIVYDLNLKNANDEKKNVASIDLYDDSNRIAVQVTSNKSADKIKDTLDKFFTNDLDQKYDSLLFVVIVNSKSYRADFSQHIKNNFKFDKEKDIITVDVLLEKIKNLSFDKLNKMLDILDFHINTISDTFHICSAEYLFDEIGRNTNGYLNESYFEMDDRRFKENFVSEYLKSDIIKINAFSKEEGLFCILNLIRNAFPDTSIFIVNDYESWMRCREYLCNTVAIPFFSADEIPAIPNSKTIFINIECADLNNELVMPKRTISFLTNKLRDNGCPDCDIVKITKGDYYYIKKKLFKGENKNPEWFYDKDKSIIAAALAGMWTEENSDKKAIEELYDGTYDSFKEHLNPYMKKSGSFIISYGKGLFELADFSVSWAYCKENLCQEMAKEYIDQLYKIICSDVCFSLKEGASRSLIFFSVNFDCENYVNQTVEKILPYIDFYTRRNELRPYLNALCEAAPDVFCEYFRSTVARYEESNGSSDEDCKIIEGLLYEGVVDRLLRFESSAAECTKTLFKLYSVESSSKMREIIYNFLILIFWEHNIVALKVEHKIQLAGFLAHKYDFLWDIIYDICMTPSLEYGDYNSYGREFDKFDYTNYDVFDLRKCYVDILSGGKCTSIDRSIIIITISEDLPDDYFNKIIGEVCRFMETLCDKDKEKIKRKIRSEIFRHQEHFDCDWAMSENRIKDMQKICEGISFQNNAYDFLYLSQTKEYPLYTLPNNYDGEDESSTNYYEKIDNILRFEFSRFKALGIKLEEYLTLIENDNQSQIGASIGRYYSNGEFDEAVLKQMLDLNCSNKIIIDYILECEKYSSDVKNKSIQISKQCGRDHIVSLVLLSMPFNDDLISNLNNQSETVIRDYWRRSGFAPMLPYDKKFLLYIQNQIKYNNYYFALHNLNRYFNKLKIEDIISFLDIISTDIQNNNYELTTNEKWILNKLVAKFDAQAVSNFNLYHQVANIEIRLIGVINFASLKIVQTLFSTDPTFYTNFVYFSIAKNQDLFDLYPEVTSGWHFCPGSCDGTVHKNILINWIKVFSDMLKKQGKADRISIFLGSLFVHSPIGNDGHFPHEFIRDIIEEIGDEQLCNAYFCEARYQRNCYVITDGASDLSLADKYKKEADFLRCIYPKTAKIYKNLADAYEESGNRIRKFAELKPL